MIWTFVFSVCYIYSMTISELIPVLQIAIGPVVLISGVGLLILSLTNRLGRVVDRGRYLAGELRTASDSRHPGITNQLKSISRRAFLLRRAIVFAVLCVLFAAILIITLFFAAALKLETTWLISALFICALGSLILCLIDFLRELNQALTAFRLEIGESDSGEKPDGSS
jgi:hypothetical protein